MVSVHIPGRVRGQEYELTPFFTNGTPNDSGDDLLVYTPAAGFSGADGFAYVVTNDLGERVSGTATVTVNPVPTFAFSAAAHVVDEAQGLLQVTVTRGGDTGVATAVDYATSNGTARDGWDYHSTGGTLNFAPGQTTKTFTVWVVDDMAQETDETFNLVLSRPADDAILGTPGAAVVTIRANDAPFPGQFQFGLASYGVNEGGGSVTISVLRVGGSDGSVTVWYATDGGTATAGDDYTPASGILTFAAGETNKTFAVPVLNDPTAEDRETVHLTLTDPTGGATLGDPRTAVLSIHDDDSPVIISPVITPGAPPAAPRGIRAELATVKARKKKRRVVRVYDADSSAIKREFPAPFAAPGFLAVQVQVQDGDGDGVADRVVVSARKGKKTFSRVFPG